MSSPPCLSLVLQNYHLIIKFLVPVFSRFFICCTLTLSTYSLPRLLFPYGCQLLIFSLFFPLHHLVISLPILAHLTLSLLYRLQCMSSSSYHHYYHIITKKKKSRTFTVNISVIHTKLFLPRNTLTMKSIAGNKFHMAMTRTYYD